MRNSHTKITNICALVTTSFFLSACQSLTTASINSSNEYRMDRYNDIRSTSDYHECRKTAFNLDERASNETSKFLASAEHFEKCDRIVDNEPNLVGTNVRLKTIAMSVQNYIKGGDIDRARTMLEHFENVANGHDLYYPDSSSFKDSMTVLLNASADKSSLKLSQQNVRRKIKDEVRRTWYWKVN